MIIFPAIFQKHVFLRVSKTLEFLVKFSCIQTGTASTCVQSDLDLYYIAYSVRYDLLMKYMKQNISVFG